MDKGGNSSPVTTTINTMRQIRRAPSSSSCSEASVDTKPDDNFYLAWDRLLTRSPKCTSATSALARRLANTVKAANRDENGLSVHERSAKSYEEAKEECKAKVRAIVAESRRLNQKYIDRHFDLEEHEYDCIHPLGNSNYNRDNSRPSAVKRIEDIFENPKFNHDNACAADVVQGKLLGDCWLLAAIMSLAAKPGLIKRLCIDHDAKVGVYGFVFFRDGAWVPEVIDDRLFLHVADGEDLFVGRYVNPRSRHPTEVSTTSYDINKLRETLQKGGEALFFARCKDNSDTWLPLMEKAYAKAHGDYGSIDGGATSEGIEDLTGGVSVSLKPSQILDKQVFWEEMKAAAKENTYIYAGGADHHDSGGRHAYAVLQVAEYGSLKLLKMRDPWGKHQADGPWMHKFTEWSSKLVDELDYNFKDPGVFWITYENFLRHFCIIDRTRIFTDEWSHTQQWTSVNAPQIAEYLDTRFVVTLAQSGPVVFVLCQPDTRYFRGLEGRYEYSLHFRVYSSCSSSSSPSSVPPTYLSRSMHGSSYFYNGLRSVTADLDLPAGTYTVLVKVTAERSTHLTASGRVVDKYSSNRREKLLQVGRNFDLAHAKGKRRDKEAENRKRERKEAKQRVNETLAKARKVRLEERIREQKRKERIEREKNNRKMGAFWRNVVESATRKGVTVPSGIPGMPDLSNKDNAASSSSALDPDAEIVDDDFEWDPEIDGSVSSDDSDTSDDDEDNDAWNAVCVLGLRVYCKNGEADIKIVEDQDHCLVGDEEITCESSGEEKRAKGKEKRLSEKIAVNNESIASDERQTCNKDNEKYGNKESGIEKKLDGHGSDHSSGQEEEAEVDDNRNALGESERDLHSAANVAGAVDVDQETKIKQRKDGSGSETSPSIATPDTDSRGDESLAEEAEGVDKASMEAVTTYRTQKYDIH